MNGARMEPARALRWAPAWVLLVVALWPLHGIATTLLAAGALAGLAELMLRRFRGGLGLMSGPAWALTGVLFAAYWLPELLSLIGAADWTHGLRKVLSDILVLPLLWLAAASVAVARGRQIVFSGLGLIALVWTVDALVAAGTGTSPLFWLLDRGRLALLGQPLCQPQDVLAPGRLAGVFGPCNPKLGIVLASLSPFALEMAWQRAGRPGWWLAALAIGAVVLLAGARAAWLTYALVLLWSGWRALGRRGLLALLAVMLLGMGALAAWSPLVQERVQRSAQALDGGAVALDAALAHPHAFAALAVWNADARGGLRVPAATFILKLERMFKGSDVPSDILPRLTFQAWAKAIENAKTPFDWLSREDAEVAAYIADPLCGFDASVSLWLDIFALIGRLPARLRAAPQARDLPVHLLGGDADPATDGGASMIWLGNRLKMHAISNISSHILSGMRHETLNEIGW